MMFGTTASVVTAVIVRRFVVLVERDVVPVLYGYFIITFIITTTATSITAVAIVTVVPRHGRFTTTLLVIADRLIVAVIVLNAAFKEITGFFFGGNAIVRRVLFQCDVLIGSRVFRHLVNVVIRHSVNSRCLLLRFLAPILLMRLLLGDAFLTARRRSPSQR